jgi:hypothetical protein
MAKALPNRQKNIPRVLREKRQLQGYKLKANKKK